MKNVGIVTIYDNNNFGNRLQAYALQKFLDNNNINSSEIVIKNSLKERIKNIIKYISNHNGYRNKLKKRKYYNEFANYIKIDYINNFEINYLNSKYDYFLVGSDQVWNPEFAANNFYFLDFAEKKKRNSYAASLGVSNISKEKLIIFKEKLSQFNRISVREESGKVILEECLNRNDIEVLLDPTLLLDLKDWKKVEKKPKSLIDDKYIFLYFLGNINDERNNSILNYAKNNNLKIINVMDPNSDFYKIGPSEFIYLIHNADLICTDSFHACVFSFLFNKPFIVFNREDSLSSMNTRIDNFLNTFKINNRVYNGTIDKQSINPNYSDGYSVLKELRKISSEYINSL